MPGVKYLHCNIYKSVEYTHMGKINIYYEIVHLHIGYICRQSIIETIMYGLITGMPSVEGI